MLRLRVTFGDEILHHTVREGLTIGSAADNDFVLAVEPQGCLLLRSVTTQD